MEHKNVEEGVNFILFNIINAISYYFFKRNHFTFQVGVQDNFILCFVEEGAKPVRDPDGEARFFQNFTKTFFYFFKIPISVTLKIILS